MLRDANGEERKGIEVIDLLEIMWSFGVGKYLPKERWWRGPDKREIDRVTDWHNNPFLTRWNFKETILRTETIRDLMLAGF